MKPRPHYSTKPYYKCFSCDRFRHLCGGMPTRDMTLQEWCEYICDVMEYFHLTIAKVAEAAEVSSKRIEMIKAIKVDQDIMRGTARRIEQVVLGPVGTHSCSIDYEDVTLLEKLAALERQVAFLLEENNTKRLLLNKLAGGGAG